MRVAPVVVAVTLLLLPRLVVGQTASKTSALTPSVVKDHLLIGPDLWSAATDQLIAKNFVQGYRPRLVAGRPDLLLYQGGHPTPAFGFAEGAMVGPVDGVPRAPRTRICSTLSGCQEQGLTSPFRGGGAFLSSDLRRVVFLEAGDVWRAEVDWTAGQVVNRKQVTQIGLLEAATPVHWYGNLLFLRANLSPEKPIVRVDLVGGGIEELATMDIFGQSMFANPSGYRLCAAMMYELLTCIDLRTGNKSRIGLGDAIGSPVFGANQRTPDAKGLATTFWSDDETAFSYSRNSPLRVVRADFRAGRVETLFRGAGERDIVQRAQLVPGGHFLALDINGVDAGNPRVRVRRHVRIDLRDGSALTLPQEVVPDEPNPLAGVWLDAEHFVYYQSTGGLSRIGTWIYEVSKSASMRVCHVPAALGESSADESNGLAYFPERRALFFLSHAGGTGVFRADLASGQCRRIESATSEQAGRVSRIDVQPFDLRLSVNGDALWR